jgi:hypothetical protein
VSNTSIVKLVDIQVAIQNSLQATFEEYKHVAGIDFPHFQDKFEKHHNCKVIKSFSQQNFLLSAVADITYWNSLKFDSSHDITMFVLKWT